MAAGGRGFLWDFLLADVALPIIGADFLRHFGLLVDFGEMQILARRGSWSQQLVGPSGSGMFATIEVVADQPSDAVKACTGKKHRHVGASSSPSRPTVEALPSPPSLPTVEALPTSPSLQHVVDEFPRVLNKSKVLPKPTHHVQHFLVRAA